MHIATNGFKNFFPTLVQTLRFNETITLVLTCPPYLVAGAISVAWAWSSGHFNERTWHITISKAVALSGFVLCAATMNVGARYFGMCVFTIGTYGVNSILLGWVGSTCGQTKEKKAASLAIANTSASLSLIWTPVCDSMTCQPSPPPNRTPEPKAKGGKIAADHSAPVSLAQDGLSPLPHRSGQQRRLFDCLRCGRLGDEVDAAPGEPEDPAKR